MLHLTGISPHIDGISPRSDICDVLASNNKSATSVPNSLMAARHTDSVRAGADSVNVGADSVNAGADSVNAGVAAVNG